MPETTNTGADIAVEPQHETLAATFAELRHRQISTVVDLLQGLVAGVAAGLAFASRVDAPLAVDWLVAIAAGLAIFLKRLTDAAVAGALRRTTQAEALGASVALDRIREAIERYQTYRRSEVKSLARAVESAATTGAAARRDLRTSAAAAGARLNGRSQLRCVVYDVDWEQEQATGRQVVGYADDPRELLFNGNSPEGEAVALVRSGRSVWGQSDGGHAQVLARDSEVVSLIATAVRCNDPDGDHEMGILLIESLEDELNSHDLEEADLIARILAAGDAFTRDEGVTT